VRTQTDNLTALWPKITSDEIDGKFVAGDWIGVSKQYDINKIPSFVVLEKGQQTAVPNSFLQEAHLPRSDIPVKEFVAWALLRFSSETISTKDNSFQACF